MWQSVASDLEIILEVFILLNCSQNGFPQKITSTGV